jgi:predicted NBD/HSP70 family sugar kinase
MAFQMTFVGTNLDRGSVFNRRVVLDAIRAHGPLSRADLTRLCGLAPQTISNIVESLLESEFVIQHQRRQTSGRGQRPIDIAINPDGGYGFGVSFNRRDFFTVLVDLAGKQRGLIAEPVTDLCPPVIFERIKAAVSTLRTRHRIAGRKCLGLGIAMTGLTPTGERVGLAPHASYAAWENVPLAASIRKRIRMPVVTDNDARAAAVGELLYGAGRAFRSFQYIYFGVGVAGGSISSGQPFLGAFGRAGEIGHLVVEHGGRPCPCGNRGCFERYTSLASAYAALTGLPEDDATVDPAAILAAFERGDKRLASWIEQAGVHLRTVVITLENIFDPETVIVGGVFPEPVLDAMLRSAEPLPKSVSTRRGTDVPRIIKATVGMETPALGAASLALFAATSADLSVLFKD